MIARQPHSPLPAARARTAAVAAVTVLIATRSTNSSESIAVQYDTGPLTHPRPAAADWSPTTRRRRRSSDTAGDSHAHRRVSRDASKHFAGPAPRATAAAQR